MKKICLTNKKHRWRKCFRFLFFGVILFVLYGCSVRDGVQVSRETLITDDLQEKTATVTVTETEETSKTDPSLYCIYICGAVRHPGVYELPAGSRIYEAVKKAGGYTKKACETCLNQAQLLEDGQMIQVLTKQEAARARQEEAAVSDGLVNINTASKDELMELPGIGASKASAIISYRTDNGPFGTLEDVMQVEGIKEGVYTNIKDHITVN